jgi:hypothetical protein
VPGTAAKAQPARVAEILVRLALAAAKRRRLTNPLQAVREALLFPGTPPGARRACQERRVMVPLVTAAASEPIEGADAAPCRVQTLRPGSSRLVVQLGYARGCSALGAFRVCTVEVRRIERELMAARAAQAMGSIPSEPLRLDAGEAKQRGFPLQAFAAVECRQCSHGRQLMSKF